MTARYPLVLNGTTIEELQSADSVTGLTSGSSVLKGDGIGGITNAVAGTDYQAAGSYAPATSGSSILSGNGSGGFSNVTVGTGLSFSAGTLSASSTSAVKQVLNTTYGTTVTVSASNTWTDTGLTLNITPSSMSSKVLAVVDVKGLVYTNNSCRIRLLRNGTQIYLTGVSSAGAQTPTFDSSFTFLDSPATTSAITYKIQMYGGSAALGAQSTVDSSGTTKTSTITLMETT